jgi:hypothetical protein
MRSDYSDTPAGDFRTMSIPRIGAVLILFIALILHSAVASAQEITPDKTHVHTLDDGSIWQWSVHVTDSYEQHLIISDTHDRTIATYPIDRLLFCEGEDDGCDRTGVYIMQLPAYDNPVIVIHALVGAHSKILMLCDPAVDAHRPIMTVYGSYFITFNADTHLTIEYDEYCMQEIPCRKTLQWPKEKP